MQQQLLRLQIPKLKQGRHVKGHQDLHKLYRDLPRTAQLNVQADDLATIAYSGISTPPSTIAFPSCPIYLLNEKQIQSSNEIWTLRWKWSDFAIQDYYTDRLQLSIKRLQSINWQAFRIARKRFRPEEQAFATKLITRWLPTGHRTEKYGSIVTGCHRCGEDETVDHLFRCQHRREWRVEFLARLDNHLKATDTSHDVRSALLLGITQWLDPDHSTTAALPISTTLECTQSQNDIGWNLVMAGLLSKTGEPIKKNTTNQKSSGKSMKLDWSGASNCRLGYYKKHGSSGRIEITKSTTQITAIPSPSKKSTNRFKNSTNYTTRSATSTGKSSMNQLRRNFGNQSRY